MKTTPEDIPYQVALLEMADIGPVHARKMIEHFGSAYDVINAPEKELKELNEVGKKIIHQRSNEEFLNFAKAQTAFCENKGARILSYYDNDFPYRLKECPDSPLLLYQQGHCNLNAKKVVAIVGTRNCTSYGRKMCDKIVDELKKYDVTIVSGLAFGIDACAHRSAIRNEMYNVAVVAHGLDRIYPSDHRGLANEVIQKGAVLTEFPTKTNPDRENFPKRNRIVAGMTDVVIVIESAIKGGSMITARLANDYNRGVFAVPGRLGDEFSEGCNHLVKTNLAHLLRSAEDIAYIMGWAKPLIEEKPIQKQLKFDLSKTEAAIYASIGDSSRTIDEIVIDSGLKISEVSTQLLMMELKGIVIQLPGKKFKVA